ncbi:MULTISPECIES: homocysteine S-methyltransferase family protein [unclassified Caballeronia]|uniref:homocysteine S-methyltransferase family protein n=1 Tax=unclassified Caballeronia TaxID=2646786 RepID=UPI00285661AD|nr:MULTISPECIES: homocysteine S-methyltransferase family protein [unclassified Caballeronia]MDR5741076.1 homocysteine S-methyltransferase family protein [Caballeronia sp. LZ016]MDR5806976.1 homocysteine S-methyltransferase family protein [Caballeronia sp. LZ019]
MSQYRTRLPQLDDGLFMTDGGIETTLIFHEGIELPCFAAFDLLKDADGAARLESYFRTYASIAAKEGVGLVLEAPTWRANADWGRKLGYPDAALAHVNRKAIDMLVRVRADFETPETPIVISGCLGPRGDAYRIESRMTRDEARAYHQPQIDTFASTAADMVAAFTITYPDEGIGVIDAARRADMPVAISFTLETDGRLPSGDALRDAVERADEESGGYAAYYMINCAHPSHFETVLGDGGAWLDRVHGVRANASRLSHAELDDSTDLDDGDPEELGAQYRALRALLPRMNVVGGCCGTDHRHVSAICHALTGAGFIRTKNLSQPARTA